MTGNYSTTVSTLLSVSTSSTISSVYAGVCTCNLGLYKQADGNTSVWRQAGRYRRHRQMDSQADTQTVETEAQTCKESVKWSHRKTEGNMAEIQVYGDRKTLAAQTGSQADTDSADGGADM